MKRSKLAALVVTLLGLIQPVAADEKVFQQNEVKEADLIDALTPKSLPPEPGGKVGRTRSIKVERDLAPNSTGPVAAPAPAAVKQAKASLLITFETNSAVLTSEAKQSLEVVGNALKADKLAGFNFSIEGHADPRGNADTNLKLSGERAEAVRQYLMQQYGLDGARLKAVGKGDRDPLNLRNPAAPENRRVTIVTQTN